MKKDKPEELFRCPYCGVVSKMVWVHGHGQCDHCKINVDECCRGEDSSCRLEAVVEKSTTQFYIIKEPVTE